VGGGQQHGGHEHLIHRDNTFGTAEEDAFRRDFTLNALFYDIATFSIIDYVGGLEDLRAGVVRCIGDPIVRFREDPVRMQRAVSFAARLGFNDRPAHPRCESPASGSGLRSAAPARLAEEYYKILRSGAAERTFRELHARRSAGASEARCCRRVRAARSGRRSPGLDAYRLRAEAPSGRPHERRAGSAA